MCFSCKPKRVYHQMFNRMTEGPIKFDQNQIEQLKKKFDKVACYRNDIDKISFKKNMGILGLKSAFEFSDRLFNSFDIDNDGKISFHDFLEYMQVLKAGSQKHKARLSFKLIDVKNKNKFDINDFKQFLNDFFKSWSSITNMTITPEIKQRTDMFVSMIFNKVKKDKGSEQIDFKYYSQKLYKDKQFLEAFEFITQGVANIFMSDRDNPKENQHSWILWKVLKQLKDVQSTVFDMDNEQASFQFQDIQKDNTHQDIPFAPGYLDRAGRMKNSRNRRQYMRAQSNSRKNSNTQPYSQTPKNGRINFFYCGQDSYKQRVIINDSFHKQDVQINTYQSHQSGRTKTNTTNFTNKNLANQKKLQFIRTTVDKILNDNTNLFKQLEETYNRADDQLGKKKQKQTIKNVHKKVKAAEGNMVFFGDDNWNMVLNMMIGIQMAVRSVKGYQEMILEEPRDFQLKYYFELIPRRFGDQQYVSTIYSFTDYAPNTFNHIRKMFNIDNEDYISSIGPNRLMASLMLGEVSSMTSLTSQGKSGSFFYYTADGKYMLKTIQYREYKCLKKILKDYYNYIKKNPETLITRFFGLHKLLEKNHKGQIIGRIYFVIMANVFNTNQKIVQRYDLKGSWYGRETTDIDPNATKKDLDFLKRSKFQVKTSQRQKLMDIIRQDAQFFKAHQIIDYSLLVGVIKNNASGLRQRAARSSDYIENRQTVIYGEEENQQKFIVGIIDILTEYDSRKVMEYYFKRTFYGEGISAVPPPQYSERFVNFIEDKVFNKDQQEPTKGNFFKMQHIK